MYLKAATRGNTVPPAAQEEVDLHYICFIRSSEGSIFEMDGDADGPHNTGIPLKQEEDMLCASALRCVKQCLARNEANMNFCLLALVQDLDTTQ